MIDPAALREALETFEVQWKQSLGAHTIDKQTQFTLVDAARELLRLMETAETVWWCEEHKASWVPDYDGGGADPDDACLFWYWATDGRHLHTGYFPPLTSCRMVEAVLTRRDTEPVETELDRNQMGIW